MKRIMKKVLRPVIFTLIGALLGLIYHYAVGCATGSCAIVSNLARMVAYGGFFGWLVAGLTQKTCNCKCRTGGNV